MQLPIKHVLTLSTFSVPLDPPNLFHGKLQILATAIMSSIYQVITFVGSYIVVCISAAFLITAIAEILNILTSLLIATISELYYILRFIDGNICSVNYILFECISRGYYPWIKVEIKWVYFSDDESAAEILWGEIWRDDSDEEEEDGSDDDWHFLP